MCTFVLPLSDSHVPDGSAANATLANAAAATTVSTPMRIARAARLVPRPIPILPATGC
jgi:hypothetical protein